MFTTAGMVPHRGLLEAWYQSGQVDARIADLTAQLAQTQQLSEAEAALWRIYPNSHAIPQQDPFEGPGETYAAAYARVTAERDEARKFGEHAAGEYNKLLANQRVLRCAFCDTEYPPDTPPSQSEALTAHVKVCPQHPMRAVEAERDAWKQACRDWQAQADAREMAAALRGGVMDKEIDAALMDAGRAMSQKDKRIADLTAQLASAHAAVIADSQEWSDLMDKSIALTRALETQLAERDAQLATVTAERNRLREALNWEAAYCYANAEKYADSDEARAARHRERGDRLKHAALGENL